MCIPFIYRRKPGCSRGSWRARGPSIDFGRKCEVVKTYEPGSQSLPSLLEIGLVHGIFGHLHHARTRGENFKMNQNATKFVVQAGILLLFTLLSVLLHAQNADSTLTGTIIDTSGKAVPNAQVSIKNVATGQSMETQTDSSGLYNAPNLTPGEYELSVSAKGFSTNISKITVAAGAQQTMNLTLGGVLSLQDLGFTPAQTQGNAQDQARLDKRSHMLKIHQRLGFDSHRSYRRLGHYGDRRRGQEHQHDRPVGASGSRLGGGDLYFTSAYFAIFAPKIPGTETRGPIRLHKALAWIHGPGMILTPILGAIAFEQKSQGEKVHGIASAHSAVAIITAAAYGAAIVSVSFESSNLNPGMGRE